ncbi:MAG: peptidyl-tRNA hydrolase [Candidatus Liptonbacteria bacterium]|nr:peptidyl-tRNA hydrolase [Candidatus Liptonbacteria bacterium]
MEVPRHIKLILGIGNPGTEYEDTYHNAGLLALEHLAAADGAGVFRRPSRKSFTSARGAHFLFARSLTFMNASGASAREACAFLKVSPNALAVLHDESDLSLGTFQCAFGKGAAGHKGIASIVEALGTSGFWRIRIGIRPKEAVRRKAGAFVLSRMRPGDRAALTRIFAEIASSLGLEGKAE